MLGSPTARFNVHTGTTRVLKSVCRNQVRAHQEVTRLVDNELKRCSDEDSFFAAKKLIALRTS